MDDDGRLFASMRRTAPDAADEARGALLSGEDRAIGGWWALLLYSHLAQLGAVRDPVSQGAGRRPDFAVHGGKSLIATVEAKAVWGPDHPFAFRVEGGRVVSQLQERIYQEVRKNRPGGTVRIFDPEPTHAVEAARRPVSGQELRRAARQAVQPTELDRVRTDSGDWTLEGSVTFPTMR